MSRARRAGYLAVGLMLATVVTACGSSSSGSPTPPSNGHTVVIKGFKFSPSTLTVPVGTKVTFLQEDGTPHTVTGSGNSAFINSAPLNKGQSYSVTFAKAGTYNYICSIHTTMHGTVVVQ
ncbi:MAG: cupredoxin domain-containing protein [Mycobacteriales bacterium]